MSQHSAPARKTSRRPSRKVMAIVGAAVLLPVLTLGSCATGAVLGSAGTAAGPERVVTKQGPERVVTKKVPGPVVTKEVPVPGPTVTAPAPAPEQLPAEKVEVEVTPQSCLIALDIAGQVITLSSDALVASADDDLDAILAANDELESLDSDAFDAAIADCSAKSSTESDA